MKNYGVQRAILKREAGMPNAAHPISLLEGGSSIFKCFQPSSVPITASPTSQTTSFVIKDLDTGVSY